MIRIRKKVYLFIPLVMLVFYLKLSSYDDRGLRINSESPINDFVEFPCLNGMKDSTERKVTCVRTKRLLKPNEPFSRKLCTTLHTYKDTPICTYDPRADMISDHLHRQGVWEKDLINAMLKTLDSTPNMMLFDVGANIGVYCISAAASNKNAICLDANYENLRKITNSLQLGGLTDRVTLIWNAVSNDHQSLSFHIAKGNVGMSRIADFKKNWHTELEMNMIVDSITLNDLQDYSGFEDRPVYMKLDVESHELFVLLGAKDFFKKIDVRVVQIELGEPETKWEVIELFEKYGFLPYRQPIGGERLLKENAFLDWSFDVFFIRNM